MTILPALRVRAPVRPTAATLGRGSPSFFRWRRVRGFSTGGSGGGGVADGEEDSDDSELTESADDPEADRSGVSMSSVSMVKSLPARADVFVDSVFKVEGARQELFARLAALCELSEVACDDAEDSSNVRFGERYECGSNDGIAGNADACDDGAEVGGGEGEVEIGNGICEGVDGSASSSVIDKTGASTFFGSRALVGFALTFDTGFLFDGGGEDGSPSGAGISDTFGRPVCGPRRFLIDEKCSQS